MDSCFLPMHSPFFLALKRGTEPYTDTGGLNRYVYLSVSGHILFVSARIPVRICTYPSPFLPVSQFVSVRIPFRICTYPSPYLNVNPYGSARIPYALGYLCLRCGRGRGVPASGRPRAAPGCGGRTDSHMLTSLALDFQSDHKCRRSKG